MTKKDTQLPTPEARLSQKVNETLETPVQRRTFLKVLAGTTGAGVAAAATSSCDLDAYLQDHYTELTEKDKEKVFARLARDAKKDYGRDVEISDPPPIDGASFAFAISLSRCNGNRRCVEACVKENNQSRDPAIQYIKVLELDAGTFNLEKGDMYYEGEVPKKDKVYLPVQCNQCENPPCVKACPTKATWKERDGIVVIDYDWCIGCRYCMAACPYEARRFNFTKPAIPTEGVNPHQGYLSNRIRPKGVVEKCHFCLHRTRKGMFPACHEACPTGARKFGDLNDPDSEVAAVLREKQVFVLKEELNTVPRLFYYVG
ncbi:MAG: 4Fe-4S dicluster domain-containing protein [Myxococcales bacterium]|nr:4Fe-4S dicluster domain-containing protein [Myxococcales bacterium]